jgi:hypothetical protein
MTLKLCHFEKTFVYVDTTLRCIYPGLNYSVVIDNKASDSNQKCTHLGYDNLYDLSYMLSSIPRNQGKYNLG